MSVITKEEVVEQILSDIWLDAPGTDAEKLSSILKIARDALAVVRGTLDAKDV